jgi:hypothetical protein
MGDSARGVVRFGGADKYLCQDSALVLLLHFVTVELYGRSRLAAKCDGHSIDNMNRLIAQRPRRNFALLCHTPWLMEVRILASPLNFVW